MLLRSCVHVFERGRFMCSSCVSKLYMCAHEQMSIRSNKNPHKSDSEWKVCTILQLFYCYFASNKPSHRTLASAFSISPWSTEETQCLFKIIFFLPTGLFTDQNALCLFFLCSSHLFWRWNVFFSWIISFSFVILSQNGVAWKLWNFYVFFSDSGVQGWNSKVLLEFQGKRTSCFGTESNGSEQWVIAVIITNMLKRFFPSFFFLNKKKEHLH